MRVWPLVCVLIVVHLDRPKRFVVTVCTGWNEIVAGEVVVKSGVGNVRIHLADTTCEVSPSNG